MQSSKNCRRLYLVAAMASAIAGFSSTSFGLTIVPTFGSSITNDPNAAPMESGINAAITELESKLSNNVTVDISFENMSTGLGESTTPTGALSYAQYHSDLLTQQALSANDTLALATLPTGTANPANSSTGMTLSRPLLRVLGEVGAPTRPDSTVSLNTSLCNLVRTGTQDPAKYDLETVALHEISEVLGAGGEGSQLGQFGASVGSLDLYRFSAPGVRSYSTSATSAYFSIDDGVTNLSNFNQVSGGDYGDWATGAAPQVQDAFGTPGTQLDLDRDELTALDVVGWNLAVPEPASLAMLGIGGLAMLRRRSRAI